MCCLVLHLLNRFEDVLAQPFAADGAIVTLDVFKPNAVFLSPGHQGPTDIFWAVVDTYGLGFSAPLDDLVQAAHDAFSGQ